MPPSVEGKASPAQPGLRSFMQAGKWFEIKSEIPGMLVRRGLYWPNMRHWKVSIDSSVDPRSEDVAAPSVGAERRACGARKRMDAGMSEL